MEERTVLFSDTNKQTVARKQLKLPGNTLKPPKYLQFDGRLYQYKGSGLGGDVPTNFYHEMSDFMVV
jgi:hypothetical protein